MEPVTAADPPLRDARRRASVLHRSHHRRTARRLGAQRRLPGDVRRRRVHRLVARLPRPALAELVPIGIGVTAYGAAYALVHDVYIHRRLRWFGGRRVGGLDRLAAAHELHHRYGGAPYGMLVPIVPRRLRPGRQASGSRPSQVPDAGVGLEAGEQLLAVPVLGAGAAHDVAVARASAANARMASRPRHRLNVPSRPTGSSPTPTTASRPGAAAQLGARPAGPAARNGRHARTRTSARVSTATGPPSSPRLEAGRARRRRATRRDRRAPRSRTCHARRRAAQRRRSATRGSGRGRPRRATRRTAPCGARSADGPVSAPRPVPSSRQNRARRRAEPPAVGGRAGASPSTAPVVPHEVERRDPGHRRTCWHRAWLRSGSSCRPSPATCSARSRRPISSAAAGTSTCAPVGDRNPGYWNARQTLGAPAGAGRCSSATSPRARPPAAIGRAVARPGRVVARRRRRRRGDGRPRLAAVRPLPRRPRRGHVRRRGQSCSPRRRGGRRDRRRRGRPAGDDVGAPVASASAFVAFPLVQLAVDGPRRTAATGALMSFVGLRFLMARR